MDLPDKHRMEVEWSLPEDNGQPQKDAMFTPTLPRSSEKPARHSASSKGADKSPNIRSVSHF